MEKSWWKWWKKFKSWWKEAKLGELLKPLSDPTASRAGRRCIL